MSEYTHPEDYIRGRICDGTPQCDCSGCCNWRLDIVGAILYCVEPSHELRCTCVRDAIEYNQRMKY